MTGIFFSGVMQWRWNYGNREVHCTPQVQDLYSLYPPSQRCGLCQNFKQTTLTTTLYKVSGSYKFVPPTYENVPTRLGDGVLPCRRYVTRACDHWPFSRPSQSNCTSVSIAPIQLVRGHPQVQLKLVLD